MILGFGKASGKSANPGTVAIGDRFVRAGQPSKIYVVTRIDERPHFPPHARLTAMSLAREEITIAVSTLLDSHYFTRAPAPAPGADEAELKDS